MAILNNNFFLSEENDRLRNIISKKLEEEYGNIK